jgi:sugar transferase (PEP-CTERM/EpsH1 system associated)
MTKNVIPLANILVVTHRVPYPPDRGDRIRNYHLIRFLAEHAHIHLACLADEPVDSQALSVLESYCREVAVVPVAPRFRWVRAARSLALGKTASVGAFQEPRLADRIEEWARRIPFQAALVSASSLAPYLRRPALRDVPAIVDLVDLDSQKWLDYAEATSGYRSWLYRIEGTRLRRLESEIGHWSKAVTLISDAEADLYRRYCGPGPVVATNGVDLDDFRPVPEPPDPQRCVFVGALDYRPNVDGAVWFGREVWPEVRRQRPGATLTLVGRNPAGAVRDLATGDGIELVGRVPDVRPYLASSSVVVVPLRIARGVQNKVLEAMAMGRAVVTSPTVRKGLSAVSGVHLEIAETATEWARTVVSLLDDPQRCRHLGAAARRYVEANHRWEVCLEPFRDLMGLATSSPRPVADPRGTVPEMASAGKNQR